MYRLVYISTLGDKYGREDVDAIIESSQRNNAPRGISGLLMFNGLNFLQLLEGNRKDVEDTYSRIILDPRHYGIVTILTEDDTELLFDQWSMRLKTRAATAPVGYNVGEDLADVLDRPLPDHIRRLITNFDTLKG